MGGYTVKALGEMASLLSGSAVFELDGEPVALDSEGVLYGRPSVRRRLVPGAGGVRMLAVGSIPGGGYKRLEHFGLADAQR
jgi:hypothetical protein